MKLFSELKRRNVFRMAVLYIVAAWLVMQVVGVLIDLGTLPPRFGPFVLPLLVVGFPIAIALSWFYEITPGGIALDGDVERDESATRVHGRRVDFIVIALLAAAVILFAYDKWWIGTPPEKSVAVLPFLNMSDDPEQGYFSDGISEELLNVLAKYPDLKVAARQSSFIFKDKDLPVAEIGRQLNVAHVVEGSVRRSGDRLRITAQLINAEDGYHLWSDTFDRQLEDVFAIQDEIAREIGEALRIEFELAGGSKVTPSVIRTADVDAYDVYLEGRNLVHRRDPDSLAKAIRHFERALRLDANFAPAHAQLAIAAILEVQAGSRLVEDAKLLAVPHIERALELEPELSEAHGASALLALFSHDPETAISRADRALALNPSYSDALTWKANALERLGRYEEGYQAYRQVLDVDPLNIIGLRNYAGKLGARGRTAEAHELADQLITVSPLWAYDLHAVTSLLYEGKIAEALYWALKQDREAGEPVGYAAYALSFVGEYDESRRLGGVDVSAEEGSLQAGIERTQRALRRDPDNIGRLTFAAMFLADAGRIDEALPLLERALELSPEERPIAFRYPIVATTLLAEGRRRSGDEAGAQAAAVLARDEYAAHVAAGLKNASTDFWGALIAAFDRDYDAAIERLRSSIIRGLRDKTTFGALEFDGLRDDPRFIAVQQELDEILAVEHEKVLQLICFNNPVPDDWRPLPETCEGVVQQGGT
jgi:TolB-like protein/Flp pilus assembly protein TadD